MVRGDRKASRMGVAYGEDFKGDFILIIKSAVDGGMTVGAAIIQVVKEGLVAPTLTKREFQNAVRDTAKNLHARYYEWLRDMLGVKVFATQEWYERGTLPLPVEERVCIDPLVDLKPVAPSQRGRPRGSRKRG